MDSKALSNAALAIAFLGAAWALWFGIVYGPQSALWTDEGDYVILARHVLATGRYQLYDDPVGTFNSTTRSPAMPYSMAVMSSIFGDDIYAGHFAVALFMAAAVLATFALAKKAFSDDLAAAFAVVFLVTSQLFWFYDARILTDGPQMLFAAVCAYSAIMVVREKKWEWLAVGAFFAMFGGLTRYTFLAILPAIAAGLLAYRKEAVELLGKPNAKATIAAIAVAFLMVAPFAAYQVEKSGSPVGLATEYFSGTNQWADVEYWFYLTNSSWIFNNSFVVLLIALGIAYSFFKRNRDGMFLSCVLVLTLGIMTAVMNWKEDRYAIFLSPMAFALAGLVAAKAAQVILDVAEKKRPAGLSAAVAALVLLFVFNATYGNLPAAWGLYSQKSASYAEVLEASRFVENITAPGEWVMAQGYTQVSAYTGRPAAAVPPDYAEFERQRKIYGARVFVASFLENGADLSRVAQAIRAGEKMENSTLYQLFADTQKYDLAKLVETEVDTASGKQKQPVLFVFVQK